jgi:hypothetical protein
MSWSLKKFKNKLCYKNSGYPLLEKKRFQAAGSMVAPESKQMSPK